MIRSEVLPTVAESTPVSSNQTEEEKNNDQFARQLQTLQSSSEQHKYVQDKLLADRQSKQVDEREKTLQQEDLERDEQRKINSHGGYSFAELRRGADLIEISNKAPEKTMETVDNGPGSLENSLATATKNLTPQKSGFSSVFAAELFSSSLPTESSSQTMTAISQNDPMPQQFSNQSHLETDQISQRTTDVSRIVSSSSTSAISIAGMTPVLGNGDAKIEVNLETKIASVMKQVGEVKGKHENTLTKEAITGTSATAQNEGHGTSRNSDRETPFTQSLPRTSLVDRVDQAKLTQRIVNLFRFAPSPEGTIRMKLHPEELGAVTLRMNTINGNVSARIETETEEARQLLLENMEQLKTKLAEQNMNLSTFEVVVRQEFPAVQQKNVKQNGKNSSQTEEKHAESNDESATSSAHAKKRDSRHLDMTG